MSRLIPAIELDELIAMRFDEVLPNGTLKLLVCKLGNMEPTQIRLTIHDSVDLYI